MSPRASTRDRRAPRRLSSEGQSSAPRPIKSSSKKSSKSATSMKSKANSSKTRNSAKSTKPQQKKAKTAQPGINSVYEQKLISIDKSTDIISIASDDTEELPSGILSIYDSSSTESDVEDLLKAITTKVSVFKGRHMQGPSKQFNANLTLTFDEFNDKLLNITKRTLGNKVSMLVIEDLTICIQLEACNRASEDPFSYWSWRRRRLWKYLL